MSFNCLYTALVTPLKEDESVDWESLDLLIQLQKSAGNELLILGSTGEGLNLPQATKEEIIRFVSKRAQGFMVGVGGHDIALQKSWMNFCKDQGAGSFLLVTPYYARPGKEGQIRWFQELMDHGGAPCMLYNIPKRAGVSIDQKALYALKNHPHLFALKEASGSLEEFRLLKKAAPEILFYGGNDDMMFELAHLGAKGLVAVMSNLYPNLTRAYVKESLKGAMTDLIAKASEGGTLLSRQNPLSIKFALKKRELISSDKTHPPLDRRDLEGSSELERAFALLDPLEAQKAEECMSGSRS